MNLKIAVLEDKENDYRILESALKIWSAETESNYSGIRPEMKC